MNIVIGILCIYAVLRTFSYAVWNFKDKNMIGGIGTLLLIALIGIFFWQLYKVSVFY